MKKAIATYLKIPQTAVLDFRQRGDVVYVILRDYRKMVIPAHEVNPIYPIPSEPAKAPSAAKPKQIAINLETIGAASVLSFIPANSGLHPVFDKLGIKTMADLGEKAHRLNRDALRKIGKALGILDASKMNKVPLVKAIKKYCEG